MRLILAALLIVAIKMPDDFSAVAVAVVEERSALTLLRRFCAANQAVFVDLTQLFSD